MGVVDMLLGLWNHREVILEAYLAVVVVASFIVKKTKTLKDDHFLAPFVRAAEWISFARKKPAVVGKGAKSDQVDAVTDALVRGDAAELQAMLEAVQSFRSMTEPAENAPPAN